MSRYLNAGEILALDDRKVQEIEVPEWNATVRIRELSARDRDWFQSQALLTAPTVVDGKVVVEPTINMVNLKAKLVAKSLVDEKGAPMFGEDEVDKLGEKNANAIDRIFMAAQRLSGLDAGAVDREEKNSAGAPSSASSTDSPAISG